MSSTPYDRQSSFAQYSAENPGEPHSGSSLDAEFNAVKTALDDTQQNLALIQDDDGALKRGSVGKEQFDSSVTIGFGAPSQWASGQIYTADVDTVFYNSIFYIANTTHTSGVSFEPAKWDVVADFTLAAVIPDSSITSAKLAPGAVTADKIGDGSISSTKIGTGAVSSAKLASQAVDTTKIADQSVTLPKLDAGVLPAGMVVPYAGSAAPTGWLFCNGQSVLRADYPYLFTALGTAYGAVDGTHFNVPDMGGRIPAGKESVATRLTTAGSGVDGATLGAVGGAQSKTLVTANLPPYTPAGSIANGAITLNGLAVGTTGNVAVLPQSSTPVAGSAGTPSASQATSTFTGTAQGGASTAFGVVQPTIVLNYIIKAH